MGGGPVNQQPHPAVYSAAHSILLRGLAGSWPHAQLLSATRFMINGHVGDLKHGSQGKGGELDTSKGLKAGSPSAAGLCCAPPILGEGR